MNCIILYGIICIKMSKIEVIIWGFAIFNVKCVRQVSMFVRAEGC